MYYINIKMEIINVPMIRKPMRYGGAGSCMLVDSDDENLNIGKKYYHTFIIYFDSFSVFSKYTILLKIIHTKTKDYY